MKPLPHAPAGVTPVVAIPVKDEDERIGACLRALCAQRDAPSHRVLLFVNDTTDTTPQDDPRQLVSITIDVAVPDEETATRFLDELRAGPRLLLPREAQLSNVSDSETGFEHQLSVTLMVFHLEGGES